MQRGDFTTNIRFKKRRGLLPTPRGLHRERVVKKAAMPIQVFDAVLSFSINGFMQVFPDFRSLSLCFLVVSIDIRDYDREHLSSTSQRCRSFMARTGAVPPMPVHKGRKLKAR